MMAATDGPWEVETLQAVTAYSECQILFACAVARALGRGKLVLTEPPRP